MPTIIHVIHNPAAGERCLRHLEASPNRRAQIVIGPHAHSIYTDNAELAQIIDALTCRSIPVVFITDDLTTLGIDMRDIPGYIFYDDSVEDALYYSRHVGHTICHWR